MSLLSILQNKNVIKQCKPNCFYLDWTQYTAHWILIDELNQSQVKWSRYIKWQDRDILLAANLGSNNLTQTLNQNQNNQTQTQNHTCDNISYLKSHLQKCIRRGNVAKSLKTAMHMFKLDPIAMLRRTAIITVEDCLPLKGYSVLLWFIAALSKDYTLSDSQIGWLLGYIHDLAKCPYYEQINPTFAADQKKNIKNIKPCDNQDCKDLCYSLMLRYLYGGTNSDKQLCLNSALLWAIRYKTNARFIDLLNRETIFITPPKHSLSKDEWIAAAIDFHCYPGVINYLWERHDQYDEDTIKKAIWHCSSSITNKKNIATDLKQRMCDNPELLGIWKTIRKDFINIGKFMIERNLY